MSTTSLFTTSYTTIEEITSISHSLNEPQWLLDRRIEAFKQYEVLPLDKDTLFYKYSSFRKFNPDDLNPVWRDESQPIDTDMQIQVDSLSPHLLETNSGIVSKLPNGLQERGVIFDSLHNIIQRDDELAKRIVSKVSKQSKSFDKLGLLARAFASNIVVLYVPKNVSIPEPLIKLTNLGGTKTANFSEFIVVFEDGSNGSFIEVFEGIQTQSEGENLFITLQSINLANNSHVTGSTLQNWDSQTVHVLARNTHLDEYATIRMISHLQGAQMSRHSSIVDLAGQGSEGYDLFVKLGHKKQRYDIKSELRHVGENTIGQTHARTVMTNKAESILRGLITIPESGVNADSWLTSKGMTIDNGKVTAVPSLEILQNDVKAAHAASVEPLNENYIFYLNSRGINQDEAKEMLVKGYFEPVLKLIKNDTAADLSRNYLSKKWDAIKF
ncbi:MAG: SufD family Fe-S cluster assembly protein [Candidatus Kariarchaeaceae archaeon]|jgi:Fe-S cluster assembly scaffold protein SufB